MQQAAERNAGGTAGGNTVGNTTAAGADEWYDQGFDLNDESQIYDYAQSGINPDLIPSAEQKLEASEYNQVRSDAQESLQAGNLKLDIEQVGQIAAGSVERRGPRRGTITVGGQGKIEDIPLSLEREKAQDSIYTEAYQAKAKQEEAAAAAKAQGPTSVYSDDYLAHKEQAEASEAALDPNHPDYAGNDEFSTRVSHPGGLSDADLRFLQTQRLKEQEGSGAKAVLPPDSAKINQVSAQSQPLGQSRTVSRREGSRNERILQRAQERRNEQREARERRKQQLQEQQARLQQQQADEQARTEAAASRLQRAQLSRAAQEAQAARAARPDDQYLKHQAAAMLAQQQRSAQRSGQRSAQRSGQRSTLRPGQRSGQSAQISHNLAVLQRHKQERAADLAQRNKEHRNQHAAQLYERQARDHEAARVQAAKLARHGSYQFEPVEQRASALDSLAATGEALVPQEQKARLSALDAVGSGAELMDQAPFDPDSDAGSATFNALQDGSYAQARAQELQASAEAKAQYEAEVTARSQELQSRLAQLDANRAAQEAEHAQQLVQEQALADEFDAWAHEKGSPLGAGATHRPTRSLDEFANLNTPTHQRTKSIYDFEDLRTAEHHRTKSLDDFQDISSGQRGFGSGAAGSSGSGQFFAAPTSKRPPADLVSGGATREEHDFGTYLYGSSIGDSALEQDANMQEYADTDHAFEVLQRKGRRMAYGRQQAQVQASEPGIAVGAGIGRSELSSGGGYDAGGGVGRTYSDGGGSGIEAGAGLGRSELNHRVGYDAGGGAGRGPGAAPSTFEAVGGLGRMGGATREFIPQHQGRNGLSSSDYLEPAQRGASVANQMQNGAGGAVRRPQGAHEELPPPTEQLADMSTAGHRARGEQEKSLEELAREYPGLSMEHLVKLKRSSNRCHLVSRTPVFDAASNIAMYELKFTAGKVFQVNALKSEHVYHVLFGYFIRRGVSCFIGRNRHVLVMMPLTYDFVDYLERYSVSRVVLRICPEQPVTPSALHLLTQLRRNGMSFAIDLMLLIKKEWNKAILSIEYVMIDMSGKVNEQLNVFQRLKSKAPWLKTIGFNDTKGDGYAYLAKRMIDFLDGPLWNPPIVLNQDIKNFATAQNEVLVLIRELFKEQPNYTVFQRFLKGHESMARDMAVFLYRFRHASPRQVQNISELYNFLLEYSANRCFSVMAARAIMLTYIKAANHSSQSILQEHYIQSLVRGYFCEYISKVFNDPFVERYGFQSGMFSLLHMFLLKEEVDVIADDSYNDIFDRIYGDSELMADIIECVQAIEATDLTAIFTFIQKYQVPPASVLISYEKALMRTNELLLVLNIITNRK